MKGTALTIGVIGGAGWLGGAVAAAILNADIVRPNGLCLSYRKQRPDRFPGASWTPDNQALVDRSDVVILSVRPADWHEMKVKTEGKLLISVMAGVPLAALCERHNTRRVVRGLPNAAAEVFKSYSGSKKQPAYQLVRCG